MNSPSFPQVVTNENGIVRISLAIKQLHVYRNIAGNPVVAIRQGEARTEIEIDDAAKDYLVTLLQAL